MFITNVPHYNFIESTLHVPPPLSPPPFPHPLPPTPHLVSQASPYFSPRKNTGWLARLPHTMVTDDSSSTVLEQYASFVEGLSSGHVDMETSYKNGSGDQTRTASKLWCVSVGLFRCSLFVSSASSPSSPRTIRTGGSLSNCWSLRIPWMTTVQNQR